MKKMFKSVLSFILTVIIFVMPCSIAFAEGSTPVEIKAKSAVLKDVATGRGLMKHNENQKGYPASVTKIMPLLLIVEAIDEGKISLGDTVTVTGSAASKGGSQIWLKEGEQMTVDELL